MDPERRKRINRIKTMILVLIVIMIIIPTTIAIIQSVKLSKLKQENARLKSRESYLQAELVTVATESVKNKETKAKEDAKQLPAEALANPLTSVALAAQEELPDTEPYYIYLTFDDGPSVMTEEILRTLRRYEVNATFFCVGTDDEELKPMYQKILDGGHTLGMHSYSHRYKDIYTNEEAFLNDLNAIRSEMISLTNQVPIYYRFPGGSSNEVASKENMESFIDILNQQGIQYVDWNLSGEDASGTNPSADEIVDAVFKDFGRFHTNVVLLHDTSTHKATVEALPKIIERARDMGAILLPISEETVPIQHK